VTFSPRLLPTFVSGIKIASNDKTFSMKLVLSLFLFAPIVFQAQIQVDDYPREIVADLEEVATLPQVKATSACGEVNVSVSDQMFSGGCMGKLVRTYTFNDDCGNKATAEQYISLKDSEKPVFVSPPLNMNVPKNNIPEPEIVTATDNSGAPVEIDLVETIGKGEITRTWIATDLCGNEAKVVQVLKLVKS
jgi:hypothetical protein